MIYNKINKININNNENKSDYNVIIINNLKKNVKILLHEYKDGEIFEKMNVNDNDIILKNLVDLDNKINKSINIINKIIKKNK